MKLPITEKTFTQDDRLYLIGKLDELSKANYSVKSSFEENVEKIFSLSLSDSILTMAKSKNVNLGDPQAIQSFIEDLKSDIQLIPKITLRLAFEPSYDLLRNISMWFESVYGEKHIVEYSLNPEIVGGVVIENDGKYLDYSLKKVIHEKLNQINSEQLKT